VGSTRLSSATRLYLQARLRDLEFEVFCAFFLDTRHQVLAFDELLVEH